MTNRRFANSSFLWLISFITIIFGVILLSVGISLIIKGNKAKYNGDELTPTPKTIKTDKTFKNRIIVTNNYKDIELVLQNPTK